MKKTFNTIKTDLKSRRQFLRQSSGALLSLPVLESFLPKYAYGQSNTKRFVAFFAPCGVVHRDYWPNSYGSGSDWQLSKILSSLDKVKDQVSVYKGLEMNLVGRERGTHARGPGAYLTCVKVNKSGNAGRSIDQVIAQSASGQTPISSLQLGIEKKTHSCDGFPCVYSTSISWASNTQSLGRVVNPKTIFDQVVGKTSVPSGNTDTKAYDIEKSILDSVLDDYRRLENKVTYLDKIKLQEYSDGIRQVEQKLRSVNLGSCNSDLQLKESYSRTAHAQIMLDLLHLALSCDQTRVASFMLDNARSEYRYDFLNTSNTHHNLSHHNRSNDKLNQLTRINTWWYQQCAYFAEKLASTADPVNPGSLLDNTIIYFSNSMSDGDNHNFNDMPVITVGGKAAGLKTNHHIDLRQGGKEKPIANFFLTLARNVYGVDIDKFGNSNGTINQVLS